MKAAAVKNAEGKGKPPGAGRGALRLLLACAAAACALAAFSQDARASCTTCKCISNNHGNIGKSCTTRDIVHEEHVSTREHITEEFDDWEKFLKDIMWGQYLRTAMQLMTEQLTGVAMHQMLILGAFLDANSQMRTERTFSEKAAQAHRDYHPDTGMCVFGTNVRSLAATERNGEMTAFFMGQRSQDRQIGNMQSAAARGGFEDLSGRVALFKKRYCSRVDDGGAVADLCDGSTPELTGKDIDFTRAVDHAATLKIDFSDMQAPTDDEIDALALANNLYAHDLMLRLPPGAMRTRSNQDEALDVRSVIAKRSVAEQSFNTLIGMKAQSSAEKGAETGKYMKVIMKQLGVENAEDLDALVGDRPSYYAQMEVLTKKIYQQPDFFADLYEKPANTDRKKVAMQAIGLMQDFDTWQSYLRTEAMLSLVLELELVKTQKDVQNKITALK